MIGDDRMIKVRTPEGIIFSLHCAGPMSRFLAWMIDLGVIIAASNLIGGILRFLQIISADFAQAVIMIAYFVISIGYGILTEWHWQGQTLGKRVLKLRVVDVQGIRLSLHQIVIRNLMRFVDSIPAFYLVGGIACMTSRYWQRLGDVVARTIVIETGKTETPDVEQLRTGKYNSLRKYPHLVARLRHQISPRETTLALHALLRRETMNPAARINVFQEMAAHIKSIVTFPDDELTGLSDEQFVRNIIECLYTRSHDLKK